MKRLPRRALPALFLLGLLALAAGSFVRLRYHGLTLGLWHQARYTSLAESENLFAYLSYHLETLQRLTFDPASGTYNFRHTGEAGLDTFEQGQLAFHRGDFATAMALLERSLSEEGESEAGLFWLALATMRAAEADNCLARLTEHEGHPQLGGHGGLCTLPLSRRHESPELSRQAMANLTRLLNRDALSPSDRHLYRWLLNFSAMTVGDWPAGVDPRDRIETAFTDAFYGAIAAATRRVHGDLVFEDRAAEMGVDNLGNGRGNAVEDFDGDGDLDLLATGFFGGVSYFRNLHAEGGRGFEDASQAAGLEGLRQPLAISPADYDGDGDLDLFVTLPLSRYHLLEATAPGQWQDVTAAVGLWDAVPEEALAVSWMATWGDPDRDGDLDLAVASWNLRFPFVTGLASKERIDTKLFENQDGRFRDATVDWGLATIVTDQHFVGATWGDFDRDGWLDLFLSSPLPATSVLLHNQARPAGGRRFVVSDRFDDDAPGFTAAFLDVNHDGRLDLFRGGAGDGRSSVEQAVFGDASGRFKSGRSTFLMQGRDGRFVPRDEFFAGGQLGVATMGASFGDLDHDGCVDVYLGTGSPEPWNILPNLMFRGRRSGDACTGELENVSVLGGFANVQKGHGIVFFDFDEDGDQDVYSSLGGMWPADRWTSQLFVNESRNENAWVKIRLRGTQSNAFGLGSRITVRARATDGASILVTHQVDNKTGFGSAPFLADLGLGRAVVIDEVEVHWLGSGCVGTYEARLRTQNVLVEGECLKPKGSGR